jgi:hypothetical protein
MVVMRISGVRVTPMCKRTAFWFIMFLRDGMKIFKQMMDAMGLGSREKNDEKRDAPDGTGGTKISAKKMQPFDLTHIRARSTTNFTGFAFTAAMDLKTSNSSRSSHRSSS